MTILSANQFSQQMVAQLRLLDPNISCEVGTPERKIIDSVAQSLADNQVDLTGLSGALDIDSKFGTNLDQFTSLFGFARQGSTPATGYVVFSRNTPAPTTINIAVGVTIQSNTINPQGQYLQYSTVVGGTIAQGATSSSPVLVQCIIGGSAGNAATHTLTNLVGVPLVSGVTSVTNPAPIAGGSDTENDNVYKVRFKNTVFRNLAGTEDQYLALAVSTAFSARANVLGPVSQYQEYIQIPDLDDAGYLNGVQYANGSQLPNNTVVLTANTGGTQNQWTTSQSSIPYAQDIYINPPPFITNGQTNGQYFFRQGVDFNFNYPSLPYGDSEREGQITGTISPNFTFLNVFNPSSGTLPISGLQTAKPGSVLLSEFSYLSAASRNSIKHNVYNCIDVYVDGVNPTNASCVSLLNPQLFTTFPNDSLSIENYRRDGEPATRPHPGNFFTPLFQSPLVTIPSTITITVGTTVYNYYLGYHYWLVHEVNVLGGSIRARDGIEWSNFLNADNSGVGVPSGFRSPPSPYSQSLQPYNPGVVIGTTNPIAPGSTTINTFSSQQQIEIDNYQYDSNITVLQAAFENARPVTTDVLTHRGTNRYFKIDVTVIYDPTANANTTNVAIQTKLSAYLNGLTFGNPVLLSDLLGVVQSTQGVSNVRWSNDLPSVPTQIRVYETDINGYPLHTPYIDRVFAATPSVSNELQRLYIPGGLYQRVQAIAAPGITIGATVTSIPVVALTQAIPAGIIYLYNSGSGQSQAFTTTGAAYQATSIPVQQQSAASSFPAGSNLYVTNFGPLDAFTLKWVDAATGSNFTSGSILFSGITATSISAAISNAGAQVGPYSNITVTQDTWPVDPHYPMASYLLTYAVNATTPVLPSLNSINVTRSSYAYDFDFYLRDNELATLPTGTAPNDTLAGLIVRPRASGTFVRPGIG